MSIFSVLNVRASKRKKNNGTIDIYLEGWRDREGASTSHAVKQRER